VANPQFAPYLRIFTLTREDILEEMKSRGVKIEEIQ
jgi:hypothetical protein